MNTSTEKLVMAMRVLAAEIQSDDGVANAAIYEAALRLEQQNDKIKRLEEAGDAMASAWDKEWLTEADIEAIIDDWHGAKEAKP